MTTWFCPFCGKEHFEAHTPCCGEVGHLVTGYQCFYTHCGQNWAQQWPAPDEPDFCPRCGDWVEPNHFEERA
jgi:hypothetical protein